MKNKALTAYHDRNQIADAHVELSENYYALEENATFENAEQPDNVSSLENLSSDLAEGQENHNTIEEDVAFENAEQPDNVSSLENLPSNLAEGQESYENVGSDQVVNENRDANISQEEDRNSISSSSTISPSDFSKIRPLIEIKAGYFFFASSKMRKIYKHGGPDVQLSASYPIWKWLQIYGSIEYLQCHGKSLHFHERTTLWEVPVSLGLKPIIKVSPKVQYYLAAGPRYFYVHQHNHSHYVNRNVSQSGVGAFVNTGFNFFPLDHFFIDAFGEYSYEFKHFHSSKSGVYSRSIQVGGFVFGLGLGYAF